MLGSLKSRRNGAALLSGMTKAFDMGNRRCVFNRTHTLADIVLYGDEKSDAERLAEDWEAVGRDMYEAIGIVGGRDGQ